MIDVGVPCRNATFFPISQICRELPHFADIADAGRDGPANRRELRVYATYGAYGQTYSYHCIAEPSGEIYAVAPALIGSQFHARFCNSDILCLVRFVLALEEYRDWRIEWEDNLWTVTPQPGRISTEPESNPLLRHRIRATICKLRDIDPLALDDVDRFERDGISIDDTITESAWTNLLFDLTRDGYWQW